MRRIARTQQRKRQTWLAMPASGIEEVGHGHGSTSAICKERGTEDLRLRVCKGEKDWLLQLMEWTQDTEQGSVMSGCLRHVHSLGREGAIEALRSRHKIEVNENVAAELYAIGQRQALRLDAEEA